MNRKLATTLSIVSTAAAASAFAAMASGNAYASDLAGDITIDPTPFVSTRTRAEVQAEVMGRAEALRDASSEWSTQLNTAALPRSGVTRMQVTSDYIAARHEVNALNAEDSGSSYLASLPRRSSGLVVAGSER